MVESERSILTDMLNLELRTVKLASAFMGNLGGLESCDRSSRIFLVVDFVHEEPAAEVGGVIKSNTSLHQSNNISAQEGKRTSKTLNNFLNLSMKTLMQKGLSWLRLGSICCVEKRS